MWMLDARYAVASAITVLSFTSCTGGSSVLTAQQSPLRSDKNQSPCPCLYAANDPYFMSITVYAAGAKGDATPIQDVTGSYTGLDYPNGVAVDGIGNTYVLNREGGTSKEGSVTVYGAGATGDVAPMASISGSATGLASPSAIALDPVNGNLYVGDGDAVLFYAPGSNGNVAPLGVITGSNTGLDFVSGLALDKRGNLYVANEFKSSVTIYAAGATGNVAPTRRIKGSYTGLNFPAHSLWIRRRTSTWSTIVGTFPTSP